MEKSTVDQLLDQLASGKDPALRQSLEDLLSSEPDGAELLNAYQKEPEKNRGLLEDVLSQALKSSDNPILDLILKALQGQGEQSEDKEPEQGSLLGEVLETLAENLLEKPKPRRKSRPKAKPKTSSSTRPKSKSKPKSKPKTGTKAKPRTTSSTRPKTKTGTKSKRKTTTATKPKPRTKAESAPVDQVE